MTAPPRRTYTDEDLFSCRVQGVQGAREGVRIANSIRQNLSMYRGTTLLQLALEVLFFLSIKDNVRLILQEVGASELACNLMKEWPEKEGIVKAAISLVSNMSYYSQDSQFAVGNAGGCEAIVAGMRKFPKNHYIQMYACLAIRNLAMENERNQQRFQEAHARTAISSAMWTHGGSAKADSVKVVPYWAKRALDVVPKQSSGVPMMALVVSDVMARFKELKSQALADELAGVDHSKCLL